MSLEGRGHASKTSCGWFMQVKDGKFVPFPKSGKPVTGTLVGTPEGIQKATAGGAIEAADHDGRTGRLTRRTP